MEDKYELIPATHPLYSGLYRIRALKSFNDVVEGNIGGWVSGEHNLSNEGACWIYDNAIVKDTANVSGDAKVMNNSLVMDNATISNFAIVKDNSTIKDHSVIKDYAKTLFNSTVSGNALIEDNAIVTESGVVTGNSIVRESAKVGGYSNCSENSLIYGNSYIKDLSVIKGNCKVTGNVIVTGNPTLVDGELHYDKDFIVIKNLTTSGRYITYNYVSDTWVIGCWSGTTSELETYLLEETVTDKQRTEYRKHIDFVNDIGNLR